MEVEVYNRNFQTWIDGSPLITTIERNDKYLKIERENHYGKPHSMQRDCDKVAYYINGVEVSKKIWQEYIRIWNKNW